MKYHIALLYCAFLAAIALSGYAYCDETPSILECKPYIEKALKDHIGGVSESTILENISGETAPEEIQSTEDVQQLDSVEIVTEASESEEKQQHEETTENTDQESSEEVTNSGEQGQNSEESKENVQDDKSAEEENAQSTEQIISDSGEQGLETQASEEHLTAEENVSEAEHIETIESVVEPSASHEEIVAEESSTEMMQDQPAEEIPVEEEQVEETQSEEHVEEAQSVEHAEEHVEEEHTEEEHADEEHAEEHAEEEHTDEEHAEEEHAEEENTEEEHADEEHTEEEHVKEEAEEHVEEEQTDEEHIGEEQAEEEHIEEGHVKDESVEEGHVEEQAQEDSEDELKQVQDEDQVQEEHADEESVVSSETTTEKESAEDQEQAQLASEEQVKEETVSVEEEVATAQASVEAQEEIKESEETATESETTGEDAVEQINAEEEKSKETEEQEEVQSEGEASEQEVQEEKETNPEDDLTKETIIPEVLRSRDHIDELLGLGEEMAEKDLVTAKAIDVTLRELKRLSDTAIKPLETLYKYRDLSNRHFGDPEIFSKPLVLFMGPWSGGKSTMINYLLNNEYNETALRTGAEPSPAYFNIVMWGAEAEVLDGTQLAADWTFSGLQKFGQGLEDRLRGLKLPNKLLEKVNIVEIPGILEVRKQVSRVFPFNDACQWFIDRADIIFLVYDPSKLDVGPETEAILDQLKGREYQTRIILNKADIVKPEELMRVQGALIWNISPLMSSLQPPVMYTTSLWSVPYQSGSPERLLYAQERSFLRDLRQAIERRVENKIASARRFAVRVRNHAKMVDCYLTTYYNHKTLFGNRKMISDEIIEHPQEYHIYEGLSTLTNISRYDLPDPDVYRDFFKLNPLYEFQQLSSTCTYFRGCPINRLDIAIAYDLPELVGKYKKMIEPISNKPASHS